MSFGTTTSQSIKHELKTTFPAVTICNNNAVMVKKLMENDKLKEMVYGTSATSDSDSASNDGIYYMYFTDSMLYVITSVISWLIFVSVPVSSIQGVPKSDTLINYVNIMSYKLQNTRYLHRLNNFNVCYY